MRIIITEENLQEDQRAAEDDIWTREIACARSMQEDRKENKISTA